MFQMFAILRKVWLKRWDDVLIGEGSVKVLVTKNSTGTVTYDSA